MNLKKSIHKRNKNKNISTTGDCGCTGRKNDDSWPGNRGHRLQNFQFRRCLPAVGCQEESDNTTVMTSHHNSIFT